MPLKLEGHRAPFWMHHTILPFIVNCDCVYKSALSAYHEPLTEALGMEWFKSTKLKKPAVDPELAALSVQCNPCANKHLPAAPGAMTGKTRYWAETV